MTNVPHRAFKYTISLLFFEFTENSLCHGYDQRIIRNALCSIRHWNNSWRKKIITNCKICVNLYNKAVTINVTKNYFYYKKESLQNHKNVKWFAYCLDISPWCACQMHTHIYRYITIKKTTFIQYLRPALHTHTHKERGLAEVCIIFNYLWVNNMQSTNTQTVS